MDINYLDRFKYVTASGKTAVGAVITLDVKEGERF